MNVTEVIDTQLTRLRTRTKGNLTKLEAEDAYADLLSTVSVVNSFWAAESGLTGVMIASIPEPVLEDVTRDGAEQTSRRTRSLVGARAPAAGGGSAQPQVGGQPPPKIVAKLKDWEVQIRNILHQIAKAIGATSYTITVGFPWGVSIAVTFNT